VSTVGSSACLYHLPESDASAKINPWITAWVQYVHRLGPQQFSVALSNNLKNFSVCCFKSLGHQIILMQREYCFLVCYSLYKCDWTILYPCEFYLSNSQGQKTDWKCYQCSELVCQDHSIIKTIKITCINCKQHLFTQTNAIHISVLNFFFSNILGTSFYMHEK
jgi:hypothetical protein